MLLSSLQCYSQVSQLGKYLDTQACVPTYILSMYWKFYLFFYTQMQSITLYLSVTYLFLLADVLVISC